MMTGLARLLVGDDVITTCERVIFFLQPEPIVTNVTEPAEPLG
jgi:hypothetical protein